eukprot:scaffold106014_cov67-Phaeocystis_antarctica.AAC.3
MCIRWIRLYRLVRLLCTIPPWAVRDPGPRFNPVLAHVFTCTRWHSSLLSGQRSASLGLKVK